MKPQMSVSSILVFIVLYIGLSDTSCFDPNDCQNRNVPSLSTPRRDLLRKHDFRGERSTPITCRNAPSPPSKCLFPFTDGDKTYDTCTGWESKENFHCSFDLTAKQHFTEVAPCNPVDDIPSLVKGPVVRMPRFFALRDTRMIYAFMAQVLELKCAAGQKITMLQPELGEFECTDGKCQHRRGANNKYRRLECMFIGNDTCCDYIQAEMAPQCNNRNGCNFTITSESCLKKYAYIVVEYFCTEKQNCVELVNAAGEGNQSAVEHYLHEQQCDVNSRNHWIRTPLFYAALHNRIDVAKTLLSRGAVRLLAEFVYETPLINALRSQHVDVSLLLLEHCDPNITWWQAVYQGDYGRAQGPAYMWYEGRNETLKAAIKNAMYRDRQRVSMIRSGEMEVQQTEWSVWGSCSVTCGVGVQYRIKNCALVDLRNGSRHVLIGENFNDTRPCETTRWSSWAQWQPCSVTCGKGTRVRNKVCMRSKAAGKTNSTETEVCGAPVNATAQSYSNVGNGTGQAEVLEAGIEPTSSYTDSTGGNES